MTATLEVTLRISLAQAPKVLSIAGDMQALLGYPAARFLDQDTALGQCIHPHDQDVADAIFSAVATTAPCDVHLRLRQANGRIRCVKAIYSREACSTGPPILDIRLIDAKSLHSSAHAQPLTANFVAMMENTGDYIYFKDRNHVFTAASQTLVQLTDPSEHWTDLIGKTDYDVFPEAYADAFYRLEKQVFSGIAVAHEIQQTLTTDGRKGWVDNRKSPITDAQGNIIGLFGIARDITEQRRAEQALIDSEKRFQTIFEQVPSISVQGYDSHRRVIYWNKASEELYGYTREQALGQKLELLIIPEPMREAVVGFVSAWAAGGPAIPASELTLQHANGTPVEVFSSHVMLSGPTGEAEMYCIDINLAERKAAERALHVSEGFLRTIIDEIPDPIVLKDHNGNFLLGNQAVAKLYNTSPQAMVGKHDGDFGVPQEIADSFRENVLGIMARGQTEVVFEDSRDAISGEIHHYRSVKKPFKNAQGENQILVVAQNITDIIRAQDRVVESEHRLQQVMEITREGIWDWHLPSGRVVHNPQWYKSLRCAFGDVPETVVAFTAMIHPQDKDLVWNRLNDLLTGVTDIYHSEHRLLRKDGSVIWVQDRGRVVERDADGKPTRVIGSFTDISLQKEHQIHLEHVAHYDSLTGLPNRVLLADRMHQAMVLAKRREQQLVVAYLDLDGFKEVNDQYGHDVGDQLLTSLASHFKSALREGDTMARLGGDEFVAVFVDLADVHASIPLVRRLLDVAAKPIAIAQWNLQVSASIGVTFYPQADEVDADQLLRQADQAMYQAKLAGKNCLHLFDAVQDRTLRVRHESLEQIRAALNHHEFVLYYQPKVNMRTGEVIGAEALVRWQHPERGLLAPLVFLPQIEGHALGIALGEWVLDAALTQIERWADQGIHLPVSVNISAHHLQQHDFAGELSARLSTFPKVQPGQLELEVLETSALEDVDSVSDIIRTCASLGVGFALDDFGTGYSSLTYLKRLPARTLKIDKSFVRDMLDDPDDMAILQGVIGLAMAFKREVIAEGVESVAHGTALLKLGCELAQGYVIARPMPADQLPAWVAAWVPDAAWCTIADPGEVPRHGP
jgi:diguanylate cyclase (GGDEF)-like protein/PAS domain S-box-containing protein